MRILEFAEASELKKYKLKDAVTYKNYVLSVRQGSGPVSYNRFTHLFFSY